MSKSNDLIKANLVLGIRSANGKSQKIDRFFINQTRSGGLILTTDSDVLPKLTFIDDNFAFCHTFFSIILLMHVKFCNNVANN